MSPSKHSLLLPLPSPAFRARKSRILSSLAVPQDIYTDKSPKGSVDAPIIELIDELNSIDGIVTTSSCSGRVAVFVEGEGPSLQSGGVGERDEEVGEQGEDGRAAKVLTGSPAGKGGGRWLFVSHDPVDVPPSPPEGFFTRLCGLTAARSSSLSTSDQELNLTPRLVKLSFSPLILHVQCSSLHHAKPLLTAAINAGFRESGVQSLKVLDDPDAGVTLGIRTAGLGLETVVGRVRGGGNPGSGDEVYESFVTEEYLGIMLRVVSERFEWNERRKERFRAEVSRLFALEGRRDGENENGGQGLWEDKELRRRRKREEGLKRQRETKADEENVGDDHIGGVRKLNGDISQAHLENELGDVLQGLEVDDR